MSTYPPQGPQQSYQQNQQPSGMFGSGQQVSPARQLISDSAPITQMLSEYVKQHPEMQAPVEQMLEILKQGLQSAISQMEVPQSSDSGAPAYG